MPPFSPSPDPTLPPARCAPAAATDVPISVSVGSQDALISFSAALGHDLNAAFVEIRHASPDRGTGMDALQAQYNRMPVHTGRDGTTPHALTEAGGLAPVQDLLSVLSDMMPHTARATGQMQGDGQAVRARGLQTPTTLASATSLVSPTTIIDAFAPPSVVIGGNRKIRHVFGNVTGFLRMRSGQAGLDLMQVLPTRTAAMVSTLISLAVPDLSRVTSVVVCPADDPEFGQTSLVRISLRVVKADPNSGQLLISSERLIPVNGVIGMDDAVASRDLASLFPRGANTLEQELGSVGATLNTTFNDLGRINADLHASNEELQGSHKAPHAVNAEVRNVDAAFQHRGLQLNAADADPQSLSRIASIPMIFLDGALCITRSLAQAAALLCLREQDLGRLLYVIAHGFNLPDLAAHAHRARNTKASVRFEVAGHDPRIWRVTIQPFIRQLVGQSDRDVAHLVLALFDLTCVHPAPSASGYGLIATERGCAGPQWCGDAAQRSVAKHFDNPDFNPPRQAEGTL